MEPITVSAGAGVLVLAGLALLRLVVNTMRDSNADMGYELEREKNEKVFWMTWAGEMSATLVGKGIPVPKQPARESDERAEHNEHVEHED